MKKHVRMSAKRKAQILMAEAAQNEKEYGEYAVQPTKLSLSVDLSAPVLGQFLSKVFNPWAEKNGKRTIGILSRSVVGGFDADSELGDLIADLPDAVSDESDEVADTIADSELPETELAS